MAELFSGVRGLAGFGTYTFNVSVPAIVVSTADAAWADVDAGVQIRVIRGS